MSSPDCDHQWTSFQDVIERLTDPVAKRATDHMSDMTGKLAGTLADDLEELRTKISGMREEQRNSARDLKQLIQGLAQQSAAQSAAAQTVQAQLDSVREELYGALGQAWAALNDNIGQVCADLANRVDHMARASAAGKPVGAEDLDRLAAMVAAGQRELARQVLSQLAGLGHTHPATLEPASPDREPELSVTAKFTRVLAVISLLIVVGAGILRLIA